MTEAQMLTLPNGARIPDQLVRRWASFHGAERTNDWLAELPALLGAWCERYSIALLSDLPTISFNLVLFGESTTLGPVVLKLGPGSPEFRSEIEALREVEGHGMVKVHASDPNAAVLLLERIIPGTSLDSLVEDDLEATRIAAQTMKRFWRTPVQPEHLWPLSRWFRELFDYPLEHPAGTPLIPADLIRMAQELGRHLLETQRDVTLLHGDLHHQNILWGGSTGWVTIDPKGLVGERGYEIATWMLNPWGAVERPDYLRLANKRLDVLAAELGEDRGRLAQWTVFHSVLSLVWTVGDDAPPSIGENVEDLRRVATLLD